MNCNMLKLNDDKTEFIVFKSNRNGNTFAEQSVQISGTMVGIRSKIKNLDQTSIQAHVNTSGSTRGGHGGRAPPPEIFM